MQVTRPCPYHLCCILFYYDCQHALLWSHPKGLYLNGLGQFLTFHFILSNHFRLQTVRRFSMKTHLSHALHIFTNMCFLMADLVLLNLTLFLTVHFHAVHGYAATHMRITHVLCFSSILPPPCGCIMLLISIMPALDCIGRSDTNMYIQYDSI